VPPFATITTTATDAVIVSIFPNIFFLQLMFDATTAPLFEAKRLRAGE